MRFICSAQRQVELGRLGNQLPVLCKANSLCDVGNISLHLTNRPINDSETVYFEIQDHHVIVSCIYFLKLCVFCLLFYKACPLMVRKNTNSRFLRFFVRSVSLFRSLWLTPMANEYQHCWEGTCDGLASSPGESVQLHCNCLR